VLANVSTGHRQSLVGKIAGKSQSLLNSVRRIAYKPWFAAVTAVVGAYAGFMAAIYADEIRRAFPFPIPWHSLRMWAGPVVWPALITWVALAGFGLMFGLNSWALTKRTDLQLGELRANTSRLQDLIQTLPPESFLSGYPRSLSAFYEVAFKGATAGAAPNDVRDGILGVLSSLTFMVQFFEGSNEEREYCANIMLYRSFEGLPATNIAEYERLAKFTEQEGTGASAWSGVLELIPSLAVFLKDGKASADRTRLPRFVLEVPKVRYRRDGGKLAVLPGAPEAFCQGVYTVVENTVEMGAECRTRRALRHSVADALDRYFQYGDGQEIRSFISIPIFPAKASDIEPVGVVNIHKASEAILNRAAFELFVPLTAPHTLVLSGLLENYLKIPPGASI
jgi:hypothetical protein